MVWLKIVRANKEDCENVVLAWYMHAAVQSRIIKGGWSLHDTRALLLVFSFSRTTKPDGIHVEFLIVPTFNQPEVMS
jgi:hypothetical protein